MATHRAGFLGMGGARVGIVGRLIVWALAWAPIWPALGQSGGTDPTPVSLLRAADQSLGWSSGVRCRVSVEAIGSMALDQPRLELEVLGRPVDGGWRFRVGGEALLADGVTRRQVLISTDPGATRVLSAERRVVMEAAGATGATLLNEAGVVPAILWLGSWDRLVSEQTTDEGSLLKMRYAGRREVAGIDCDVVQVDYTGLNPQLGTLRDQWWFFDRESHLPVRIEACHFRRDQNAYGYFVLTISALDVEADLSDADLTLQVPAGHSIEAFELPQLDDAEMGGPTVGEMAPDWTLRDPAGRSHTLNELRGQVVVMDFWASWCGPCIAAMPGLQALHERYSDDPVRVYGLNMSDSVDPAEFMASRGFTYGLLVDSDEVAGVYDVNSIPALWVIGPDGRVLFRQTGFSADLETKLRQVIDRTLRTMTPQEASDSAGEQGEAGGSASPRR